jgi:hypothetical protein
MVKKHSLRKKHHNWCDFGEHNLEDGQRPYHVHPIPACEAFPDGGLGGDGGTACDRCYPEIKRLQIEQGILLV